MERLNFDDIIKRKLDSIPENFQEANWDLMEKKIFAKNEEIDDVAFEKLKDLKIPFDAKSWTPLAKRIEAEFNWLNIVFKYKFIELSFLLLIPFLWEFEQNENIEIPDNKVTEALQIPEIHGVEKNIVTIIETNIPQSFPRPIIALDKKDYLIEEPKPKIRGIQKSVVEPLETINSELSIIPKEIIQTEVSPTKSSFFVNMKAVSGAEINRVTSPMDLENRLLAFDRLEPGVSGGILFEFGEGIWSFETGVIYSSKIYSPRSTSVYSGSPLNGFFRKSMDDIHLNIINIPFDARKEILELNKLKLYGVAGVSLQVAYTANYDLKFDPLSGQGPSKVVNLSEGWLEGGSFKDNGYLTVNFGMSLERELSDRWTIFVQPTYQHTAVMFGKGIGPDFDRIQTLSLFSGIKVNLYR